MGVQGAAIATVSAEWAAALAFLVLLERKDPAIRFGFGLGLFVPVKLAFFFNCIFFIILGRVA